ncbi:serine/threonine-protein kinase PknL [Rhodococcus sp. MTM3W5.2]|nr:serine/threonine-protein kinase PknL [Rhodococcus sp. MTM3W5.2]
MGPGDQALIGTLLDRRYRVDSPIARGGMSMVYRGLDMRLDRPVAIKVMDPKFAHDPQFVARFEFEARAVARLTHPGLVAVYDQGVDGEHAFLVMELVAGGTLRELLRERGPMPPHAAAAVTGPVLDALAVAHRAGLVHRDIKPENVLISDSGEVKIADFGLVRAVAGSNATSSSVILGTAAYLSPSRSPRATPTPAAMCTRPACCYSKCSPAERRSPATPRSRSPISGSTPTCQARVHRSRGCRRSSTSWCSRPPPVTPRSGSRTQARCRRRCVR